jgi:hypothetical protein
MWSNRGHGLGHRRRGGNSVGEVSGEPKDQGSGGVLNEGRRVCVPRSSEGKERSHSRAGGFSHFWQAASSSIYDEYSFFRAVSLRSAPLVSNQTSEKMEWSHSILALSSPTKHIPKERHAGVFSAQTTCRSD